MAARGSHLVMAKGLCMTAGAEIFLWSSLDGRGGGDKSSSLCAACSMVLSRPLSEADGNGGFD